MLRVLLQILGVLALLLGLTLLTLRLMYKDGDGPSRLFPGGALVSGELHSGAEPDWSFTDDVFSIELQLENPLGSRKIFVMESGNKVYVPSGYMRSTLGRLWKDWAFKAEEGDGLAVALEALGHRLEMWTRVRAHGQTLRSEQPRDHLDGRPLAVRPRDVDDRCAQVWVTQRAADRRDRLDRRRVDAPGLLVRHVLVEVCERGLEVHRCPVVFCEKRS